ncbi:MAG: putative endonuclease [Candidatus Endobugula sp.]|jgi:putative endonuclease
MKSDRVEDTPQKNTERNSNDQSWCVYILNTSDQKMYTGITNNMLVRWEKHRNKKGAKFFRGRSPIALCFQEPGHSRSSASKREYQIKQLTKQQKQQFVIQHYGPHRPTMELTPR